MLSRNCGSRGLQSHEYQQVGYLLNKCGQPNNYPHLLYQRKLSLLAHDDLDDCVDVGIGDGTVAVKVCILHDEVC